ncbi:MAG: hypothetical protein SGI77_05520 [Pirellulaceae bacterium]|nr:hypothetical protein [Pirellulaceae bacterium]
MKKFLICTLIAGFSIGVVAGPALAIKEFGEHWGAYYVANSKNEDLKKLAGEAKCNVCHIDGENKKKHNPYGQEVAKILKKKAFKGPPDRFKEDADKAKTEIEAAFKKIEEIKAKDGKTFGEKIKAGQLPGGDTKGK